ncbi:MAG: acetylxylan esterase [Ruminococcaceae bacterium]|nr:acetylxylan esterase [Oscillospiraceae bacterium]
MKTRILSFFLAVLMIMTSAPLFVIQSGAEEASQATDEAYDYDALYVPGAVIKYDFYDFTDDGSVITTADGYGGVYKIEKAGYTYGGVGVYKRDRHVRFYDQEETENGKMYAVSYMQPTKPDLTASKGKTYTFQFVVKYAKNAGHLDLPHARMTFKNNGGYIDMASATQLLQKKVNDANAWISTSTFTNESGAANSGVLVGDTNYISCFALYDSENLNPYSGAGTVKVAVEIGDMKKSFEYSYTADNPISAGYVGLGGYGKSGEFYAYRVYDRELTEAEIKQNHFADLAKFYRFDPSDIETLFDMPDYLFEPAYTNTLKLRVDADITVAEGQAAFKKILNEAVENALATLRDSYYVTDGLVFRADFFDATTDDYLVGNTALLTATKKYAGTKADYEKFIKYASSANMYLSAGYSATKDTSWLFEDVTRNYKVNTGSAELRYVRSEFALLLDAACEGKEITIDYSQAKPVVTYKQDGQVVGTVTYEKYAQSSTPSLNAKARKTFLDELKQMLVDAYANLPAYPKTRMGAATTAGAENLITENDDGSVGVIYGGATEADKLVYTFKPITANKTSAFNIYLFYAYTEVETEWFRSKYGYDGFFLDGIWSQTVTSSTFRNGSLSLGYKTSITLNGMIAGNGSALSDMSIQYVYSNSPKMGSIANQNSVQWYMPLSRLTVGTTSNGLTLSNAEQYCAIQGFNATTVSEMKLSNTDVTDFVFWFDRTEGNAGTGAGRALFGGIINGTDIPRKYFPGDAEDGAYTLVNRAQGINLGTGGNINLYAMRVYDRVINADEVKSNHISDMMNYYDFSVLSFLSLTDEQKEWVISEISKLTFESFKVADVFPASPDKEAANAYFENLVAWSKLEFKTPTGLSGTLAEELQTLVDSLTWDNYKDKADPAAEAQAAYDKFVNENIQNGFYNTMYTTDGLIFRADFFDATESDYLTGNPTQTLATLKYAGQKSDYTKFIKYAARSTFTLDGCYTTSPETSWFFEDFNRDYLKNTGTPSVQWARNEFTLRLEAACEGKGIDIKISDDQKSATVTYTKAGEADVVKTYNYYTNYASGSLNNLARANVLSGIKALLVEFYDRLPAYPKTLMTSAKIDAAANLITENDDGSIDVIYGGATEADKLVYTFTPKAPNKESNFNICPFSQITEITREYYINKHGFDGYYQNVIWTNKFAASKFNNGSYSLGAGSPLNVNVTRDAEGNYFTDASVQYIYSNKVASGAATWYVPFARWSTTTNGVLKFGLSDASLSPLKNFATATTDIEAYASDINDFVFSFSRPDGTNASQSGRMKVSAIFNGTKVDDKYFPGEAGATDGTYTTNPSTDGFNIGVNGDLTMYAIRVYDKVVTEAEVKQNHLADMYGYYKLPVINYLDLQPYQRQAVDNEVSMWNFDTYETKEEAQAAYEELVLEASEMNLPELTELVDFLGYSTRINSYPGIRAQFTMNEENLAALEEQGYNVEVGVIMAISDGKEYSDLTVYNNEGSYETVAEKALCRAVYKTGEGEDGYVANSFIKDGKHNFVYAIVYEKEAVQTAEYYTTNCMYRGYAVAKKEGSIDIVVYFDCGSDLFGKDISIYELTAYHAYEEGTKATDDTFLDVIEKAGYTTDMKDAIALLNDCNTKFAAGEEITFSDLNKLYNYQLKANKDSCFRAQMKYYEPNGTLTLEKGSNDDLYDLIDTFWGIYNTKLGVDIRDSLYEIGSGSVEVYFEDISDTVEGNKKAYEYVTGDDVVFKLALRQKGTNILFPCTSFTYKYRIDGVVDANGKTIEYTGTQADDDGIFELTIPASKIAESTTLTANKGALIELLVNASSEEASLLCEGGATNKGYAGSVVINFDDLKPTQPKPDDYESFWAEQIERLENTDPTDSTVPTESTRYSATTHEDIVIAHDVDLTNYFHITKFDKALLASYREKGLSSASDTYLDSYDVYEISLNAPGPNPTTGILTIPKNKTNLNASLSFAGYGVSSPAPSFSSSSIIFNVTHHGYPIGQAKDYYDQLFKNGGILGSYGLGKNKPNSTYINKDDCYILYMFLRNLQAVRFIDECLDKDTTGLAADAQELYANLKRAYSGKITLAGGSMGGYQTIGTASLASMAGYNVIKASPSVPALCNAAGYTLEGRVNNIFGFGYEITDNGKDYNNMDYFDGAFFAEYIECETVFTKVGLGDYTCPPSGIIIAYNALKCKKSMNLYQNAQHDYWPTRVVGGVTEDTNPVYTFASEAVTE